MFHLMSMIPFFLALWVFRERMPRSLQHTLCRETSAFTSTMVCFGLSLFDLPSLCHFQTRQISSTNACFSIYFGQFDDFAPQLHIIPLDVPARLLFYFQSVWFCTQRLRSARSIGDFYVFVYLLRSTTSTSRYSASSQRLAFMFAPRQAIRSRSVCFRSRTS